MYGGGGGGGGIYGEVVKYMSSRVSGSVTPRGPRMTAVR